MAESRFEKLQAEAFQTCADRITEELVKMGVDRSRATGFVEDRVEFLRMPGSDLKINARCGGLSTRGASDNSLIWFARELHCEHAAELGGQPKYFGNEQPPEYDHIVEEKARVKAEIARVGKVQYDELIELQRKQAEAFLARRVADANRV